VGLTQEHPTWQSFKGGIGEGNLEEPDPSLALLGEGIRKGPIFQTR